MHDITFANKKSRPSITGNETAVFFGKGREVKVHAIQTGLISVKKNFLTQKGQGFLSKLNILFAGEVSYKYQQLLDNQFGGANINFVQSQKSYNNILMYAEKYPVIYLPSHDENSANRLCRKECLVK